MERNSRTIVGGRTVEYPQMGATPRGIEVLLKKAKVDAVFRERFLGDPVASALEIDLELTPSEKGVLSNTSRAILKSMIDNTFVPRHHVSTFLQRSSVAMLALLLGSVVIIPTHASAGIEERTTCENFREVDLAQARMASIQAALEQYRLDHGSYPSTEAWVSAGNPLEGYVALANLWDPWMRKFHYQTVENEAGEVVSYRLESLGPDPDDPADNIPCPSEPQRHGVTGDRTK